ncbi:MAG: anthranilate synthase component I family protein [Desulfovibrio sp.]|jgi:anthranilate synthase component 1|nr:anthranilate synthase component I family protein [Desulfovibrio sp.]
MSITLQQNVSFLQSDVETPISLFMRLAGDGQGILLESAEVGGRWGRYSLAAADFILCLRCRDGKADITARDRRLEPLRALHGQPFSDGFRALLRDVRILPAPGAEFPSITRALYGYLGYGCAGLLEPKTASFLPPQEAEACLALPGTLILYDHEYNRVCRLSLHDAAPDDEAALPRPAAGSDDLSLRPAGIGPMRASKSCEAHIDTVRRLKEQIRLGEAVQIVPSVAFNAAFNGDPFTVYRRLRRINPSPYMFFMRLPDITLMGSSPEVMVSCAAGKLRLCPIAGTRPRGAGPDEDNLFEEELAGDAKEQSEHVMLVDLGRNDLGRVAVPGSVVLDRYMEVERFSHVMHLTSHISAQLLPGLDAVDVLRAVFPAGTVSGAPKIRAMELLAAEEQGPRGPYAGAVGWFGLDGQGVHMDTGITIRSLWIRDGRAFWQAGGGVVHDSSPEAEWKEIVNKAAAVQAALIGNANGEPRPPQNTPDRSGQHPDASLAGTGAGGSHVSAH